MARIDRVGDTTGGQAAGFGLAVGAPLAVVALAYGLFLISDRALYIGPLDRATFGWVVVFPIWVVAPFAGGLAWQRLTTRASALAAIVFGAIVSIVAAILFWQAVAHPGCEYGAVRSPTDWVLPSLFIGLTLGSGLAVSGSVAVTQLRGGHPWRALVLSAGVELVLVFAAIFVLSLIVMTGGCQRPPAL